MKWIHLSESPESTLKIYDSMICTFYLNFLKLTCPWGRKLSQVMPSLDSKFQTSFHLKAKTWILIRSGSPLHLIIFRILTLQYIVIFIVSWTCACSYHTPKSLPCSISLHSTYHHNSFKSVYHLYPPKISTI